MYLVSMLCLRSGKNLKLDEIPFNEKEKSCVKITVESYKLKL